MKPSNMVWGVLLIVLGILLIVNRVFNVQLFTMGNLWPVFVLGAGLIFEATYLTSRRNPGILVPGGILTVLGILFFFETFTDWGFSAYTWPIYVLAPAFGLFQLFLATRQKALLIPVLILTLIASISLIAEIFTGIFSLVNSSFIMGAIFIAIGVYILYKMFSSKGY